MPYRRLCALIITVWAVKGVIDNKGCPSDPTRIVDLEQFFGSKTPYDSARRMLEVRQPTSHHRPCERSEVVMVWAVVRHGSRCPTPHRFRDTVRLDSMLANLTDWCPRERPYRIGSCVLEDAGMLTEKGQVEMYELGQRMRARFPSLFKSRYSPIRYDIQSSHPFRALQSAYSFAEGVFGGTGNLGPANSQPIAIRTADERMLYFHKACEKYRRHKVAMREDPRSPVMAFEHRLISILQAVEARLNLQPNDLSLRDLRTAWDSCKFGDDRFCALFNKSDAEILEFRDDLASYYEKGYGAGFNQRISCKLVDDLVSALNATVDAGLSMRRFKGKKTKKNTRPVRLRFAHAETLYALLPVLGLHKDPTPLTPNDDLQKIRQRKWDSSMMPFASSIQVSITKCFAPAKTGSPKEPTMIVKLLHNEIPMDIPICGLDASGHCTVSRFLNALKRAGSRRQTFDDMCRLPNLRKAEENYRRVEEKASFEGNDGYSAFGLAVASTVSAVFAGSVLLWAQATCGTTFKSSSRGS